jgi:hypothetical protein
VVTLTCAAAKGVAAQLASVTATARNVIRLERCAELPSKFEEVAVWSTPTEAAVIPHLDL